MLLLTTKKRENKAKEEWVPLNTILLSHWTPLLYLLLYSSSYIGRLEGEFWDANNDRYARTHKSTDGAFLFGTFVFGVLDFPHKRERSWRCPQEKGEEGGASLAVGGREAGACSVRFCYPSKQLMPCCVSCFGGEHYKSLRPRLSTFAKALNRPFWAVRKQRVCSYILISTLGKKYNHWKRLGQCAVEKCASLPLTLCTPTTARSPSDSRH